MRDTSTASFGTGRIVPRATIAAALLALMCGLGGCASSGSVDGAFAMAAGGGSGTTVTFESIDGPPPQVFDRMVSVLDTESKLRNLAIVSREGSASYRVRSYLSAQVSHGRTTIAWVWDVYDRDQQRALRLSGQEPAGKADESGESRAFVAAFFFLHLNDDLLPFLQLILDVETRAIRRLRAEVLLRDFF